MNRYSYLIQGKRSPIKCKREASAPKLMDFVTELKHFDQHEEITKYVRIVTDDVFIDKEIEKLETKLIFLKPDPAPRRTVDKVKILYLFVRSYQADFIFQKG